MATWRRIIVTGLLLAALSLLVAIGHGRMVSWDGETVQAAAVEADRGHPCAVGSSCAPFVAALEADAFGIARTASRAHLQGLPEPIYLSPHLTNDPPPPKRAA